MRMILTTFAGLLTAGLLIASSRASELDLQEASQNPETPAVQSAREQGEQSPPADLPVGHPKLSPPRAPADVLPPVDAASGTGAAALAWIAPESWVSEPPASAMRRAQYRVPGAEGDGECIVFYFGPGQGGEPMDNAERWASQFTDAGGQPASGSMKTRSEEIGDVSVLFVEAAGTYLGGNMMGMGQSVARPDWALLGAVAEGPDANWFFKLTGPRAVVDAQRSAFEAMLRSVKRGD